MKFNIFGGSFQCCICLVRAVQALSLLFILRHCNAANTQQEDVFYNLKSKLPTKHCILCAESENENKLSIGSLKQ